MFNDLRCFISLTACAGLCAFGQTSGSAPQQSTAPSTASAAAPSVPTKVEMPNDPAALLELVSKKNGLQNAGIGPWHLKATYELLDDQGAAKEAGTYEEFWISAKKSTKSYTSPSFTQTDYSTEGGVFRTGNPKWPDYCTSLVRSSFFPAYFSEKPLAEDQTPMRQVTVGGVVPKPLTGARISLKDTAAGGVTLKCISISIPPAYPPFASTLR
jgi:hypothetical protein